MGKLRKQNLFNTISASIKFLLFWILIIVNMPLLLFIPVGKISVGYFRVFTYILVRLIGVRVKISGKLTKSRPLMVVSNHISVAEFITFPSSLGGSFFGKKEIEKFPIIGWVSKRFGVIFVDRRPSHAKQALENVRNAMDKASYPMFLFPEGTTTNGAYVKQFKSTLFHFVADSNITVQPVVMHYRYKDGSVIDDQTLADHFAYFDNIKQDMGPSCARERSAFGQVFHLMMLGGVKVEITVLPAPDLKGLDRKEIAKILHKQISDKYMELKDKKIIK